MCTLASKEFLERSSNDGYHYPECPQDFLWDSTGKWSCRRELKLLMWQTFVRTERPSLQTKACLKPGWGQTTRRGNSSLSTRWVFNLKTQFSPPLIPVIPEVTEVLQELEIEWCCLRSQGTARELLGGEARKLGGCLDSVVKWSLFILEKPSKKSSAYGIH